MRIVVDLNHPAHVHYFKNFIRLMEEKGHTFLITASEKEMTYKLLDAYGLPYVKMGSYGKKPLTKLLNVPRMDIREYQAVKKFNPDILMGFGSVRAAHAAFFMRKWCINFDDTENPFEQRTLYLPFVSSVCTPSCFGADFGKKQIRFDGYMELCYLHPNYFTPDPGVLDQLGIQKGSPFTIMRFVSWLAFHDIGHGGLSLEIKRKAVKELEKFGPVYITSESPLPREFEPYRIRVPPEKIHDLMAYATLLYGESATMASECAVLGTHAIFCDFKGRTYCTEEEQRYGLVSNFRLDADAQNRSLERAIALLNQPDLAKAGKEKRTALLREKIDVTAFMVWFVDTYPDSIRQIRTDPKSQDRFRGIPAGQ